jgi:hypothetical protein
LTNRLVPWEITKRQTYILALLRLGFAVQLVPRISSHSAQLTTLPSCSMTITPPIFSLLLFSLGDHCTISHTSDFFRYSWMPNFFSTGRTGRIPGLCLYRHLPDSLYALRASGDETLCARSCYSRPRTPK